MLADDIRSLSPFDILRNDFCDNFCLKYEETIPKKVLENFKYHYNIQWQNLIESKEQDENKK